MFGNNTIDEISWSKMGVPISSSNPKYKVHIIPGKFKKFSTKLCIRSLNRDDSGTYTCGIKSSTKQAHADGKLQVLGKCSDDITVTILLCMFGKTVPFCCVFKYSAVDVNGRTVMGELGCTP